MSPKDELYIGIDVGGTKLRGILVERGGRILEARTLPTKAEEGEEAVYARIAELTGILLADSGGEGGGQAVAALGIGAPGPLDSERGIILRTENLPFKDFPLAPKISERFNIPVFLENDGSAAAYGEYVFGDARGADPLLYLTASTGIGAGLVIGGRLYRGRSGNALEAGHMVLVAGGPACACGGRGCAEALASGSAIAARAREAAELARRGSGPATRLSELAEPRAPEVFALAEQGDSVAAGLLEEALSYLGLCAANLVSLFDPEALVLGGGLAKAGPRAAKAVEKAVRTTPTTADSPCRILSPGLGEDAGALGAAALAAAALRPTLRARPRPQE